RVRLRAGHSATRGEARRRARDRRARAGRTHGSGPRAAARARSLAWEGRARRRAGVARGTGQQEGRVIDVAKDKKSKKSGAPGTAGIAEQWDAAAKTTNGAKDKPTDKRPPVQTRLDLGDERVEYQEIEIEVPLSPAEAILLERRATEQLA